MDTQDSAVAEFKIAKVGQGGRRRKGGGLPLFGGGTGGGGAFSGAVGGSGAAAAGAGLAGKVGVMALIAALSAGAWQVGKALRPEDTAPAKAKPKVFADAKREYSEKDLAGVLTADKRAMPNSLGYVSGSLDGMTAEERARKQAEADAAARKAQEQAKAAEEEAAKQPADVAGSPAGADADALVKGMTEGKDGKDGKPGPFAKKFGAMSSSFGGNSLSGGAGLAGGVGRGFQAPSLNGPNGGGGRLSSMRGGAQTSVSKAAGTKVASSKQRGFARRQLSNAFALSRQAVSAGRGETSAQSASMAFDNNAGEGNIISGSGVSEGAGTGVSDAGGSTNPDSSGGSGGSGEEETDTPESEEGENVTKWQGLIDAAQVILAIIAVLAVIMMIFKDSTVLAEYAEIIYMIMVALAAVVCALGVAIMGYGQYLQGGILTAVGAFVMYSAWGETEIVATGTLMSSVVAEVLVASAVGMLAGSLGGSSSMS